MLKQLSIKFLQRDQLQMQREFLKPFETIFLGVDESMKEYILDCVNHIVLNYKYAIKGGWRIIFDLINYALAEESVIVSRSAYFILKRIMDNNLDMIGDVFVDLIQSL
jgi:brefeldin A-inhibited guanine nucleotide-exchange protein